MKIYLIFIAWLTGCVVELSGDQTHLTEPCDPGVTVGTLRTGIKTRLP